MPTARILSHLIGSEQLLASRALRMLDEDEPHVASVAPDDIDAGVVAPPTFAGLLEDQSEQRRATHDRLVALPDGAWQRRGFHPEWGWLTVQQISYLVRHEQAHLAELEARAHGADWEPGMRG